MGKPVPVTRRQIASGLLGTLVSVVDSATGTERFAVPLLDPLEAAFFLKEGSTIATLAVSSTRGDYHPSRLVFWDAATGKRQTPTKKAAVPKDALAALRSQGDLAIFGSPRSFGKENLKIPLWDVASAKVVRTFPGYDNRVVRTAFSADGFQLAAACSTINEKTQSPNVTIHVWEVATGKELHTWKIPTDGFTPLAFAPNGKTLALAGGFPFNPDDPVELVLLDLEKGKSRVIAFPEPIPATQLAFSADGRLLAVAAICGGNLQAFRSLFLLEVASGRLIWKWSFPPSEFENESDLRLAFAADSRSLLTTHYQDIRCWHATTGKVRDQLAGHLGKVTNLTLSPDGSHLVTASMDRTALVWDVAEFLKPPPIPARKLTVEELKHSWEKLASRDQVQPMRPWNYCGRPQPRRWTG